MLDNACFILDFFYLLFTILFSYKIEYKSQSIITMGKKMYIP